MKKQISILLLLASSCFIFAKENPISTLEYRVYQWTKLKNPKEKVSEGVDPFSQKGEEAPSEKAPPKKSPPMTSEERYIVSLLDLEITEENGTFFYFDGESIYARIAESDHEKLETAMETKGVEVSNDKESEILKLIEERKQKPNQSGDGP